MDAHRNAQVAARPEKQAGPSRDSDGYCPIEDYALIGDGLTAALVARDGSIDWACFPRFDSPTVFARILDAGRGGSWQIAPTVPHTVHRRYLPDTNVLATSFTALGGVVEVLDFMPPRISGRGAVGDSAIVRLVQGREGTVEVRAVFEPRFDYARATPTWEEQAGFGVRATYRDLTLTLQSKIGLEVMDNRATATWTLAAGDATAFILTCQESPSIVWRSDVAAGCTRLLDETVGFWRTWIGRCTYDGAYSDVVRRSALALKLLDYAPTGAIIAAPTASLPEEIGGVRNWDYRYSWLRDTAFTVYALYAIGYRDEAEAFLNWIIEVERGGPASLQIMYGVDGERRLDEAELNHLAGYRGSRPVRIGNGAYTQRQHDVYGETLDCAFLLQKHGGLITDELWTFLRAIVDYICEVWGEPDDGIWEVRSGARHFVYSKALCWVGVDRGIKIAERGGLPANLKRWRAARAAIHEDLFARGYSEREGAFTQDYSTDELDASALALLLRGVLPPDDPRMASTVDRVAEVLGTGGLVHRYSEAAEDGLTGSEGAFLMCSFWLVDCYALMGRREEARALLDHLIGLANDVGLYAEQIHPESKQHLGNFPQAFTHIALINAVLALAQSDADAGSAQNG
jgi:GH15 family glucan-1,4-alpha-glucosidase